MKPVRNAECGVRNGEEKATAPDSLHSALRTPHFALTKPLAVPAHVAAWMLGISRTTLWTRVNLPKSDPRRIKRTSYNTYPVVELQRHIQEELKAA